MTSTLRARALSLLSVSTALRVVVAAGLGVDARIHLKLAAAFDSIKGSGVSQGELFRVEAVLAIVAGVLVLVVHKRFAALIAAAVAGGGLVPLLVYRYFDIGALGPLPAMYEPAWYPDKTDTALAQGIAAVAALILFACLTFRSRREGLEA